MASQSVSNFAPVLKTLYPTGGVPDLTYPQNALFALVPKRTDFVGENMVVAVHVGDVSGLNQSFSTASGNQNGTIKKKFTVTRKTEYGLASIDGELIEASASDAGALVRGLKSEIDSCFKSVARRIGEALYRDGSGALGTISSTTTLASTSLKLANADDVTNFSVNQQIVFAANTSSNLRSATARTITAIDEDTATLTLDGNVNAAATTIAHGDTIFTKGDYTAASERNRIMGLAGWIPGSIGTSDSFFSLNRSTHPTKLGGHRITGTALQLDEAIYKAATRIARSGAKASHALMSFGNFEVLQNVLGNRGQNVQVKASDAEVYFDGIKFMTPAGELTAVPDYNCQSDIVWVGDVSKVKLCSLNGAPHILGQGADGLQLMRSASADSYEVRVGFYGNFVVAEPYSWARVSVTAPT